MVYYGGLSWFIMLVYHGNNRLSWSFQILSWSFQILSWSFQILLLLSIFIMECCSLSWIRYPFIMGPARFQRNDFSFCWNFAIGGFLLFLVLLALDLKVVFVHSIIPVPSLIWTYFCIILYRSYFRTQ